MESALIVFAILCLMIAFIGCVVPGLPGTPLALIALLLFKFTSYGTEISWVWIGIFAVIVIISVILDYMIPALGTKMFGGTKAGVWGSIIGAVLGMFFLPIGIFLGPFLGAFAGEMIAGKNTEHSLKAAFGAFAGFMTGMGLKLIICIWISVYIVWVLFF